MIRYLRQEEKAESRSLWEEAFPEDSRDFCDYYYTDKVKDNQILVREEGARICAMIHLNPYVVEMKGRPYRLDYIVGVATAGDSRRRGYMRGLLTQALRDMYEKRMPFTFLMPADRRIYEPFDFAYIFDQPKWELAGGCGLEREPWKAEGAVSAETLAGWMNRWLEQEYEVYCRRDRAYVERLSRELASEGGGLELLYAGRDGGGGRMRPVSELDGIYAEWGIPRKETRALLCRDGCRVEAAPAKPAIMARIVDLQVMARAVCLREDWAGNEAVIPIEIEDPILAGNRGKYRWHLVREGSWLEEARETPGREPSGAPRRSGDGQGDRRDDVCRKTRPGEAYHRVPIARLAGWLFGYEPLPEWAAAVRPLRGVFLDEVV